MNKSHPFLKKLAWLSLFIIPLAIQQTVAQETEKTKNRVWQLLRSYSPDSYHMMQSYYSAKGTYQYARKGGATSIALGRPTDFLIYVDAKDEESLLRSLNTVVHEICHGYTSRLAYQALNAQGTDGEKLRNRFSLFFLDKEDSILVPHTEIFNSSEIHPSIPEELQTLRYNTYIYPKTHIGSQVEGVYGLLDEMNAYYHGTRTAFELYPYFRRKAKHNPKIWLNYFSEVNSTYFAHLEFKYYLLKYLLYAKINYPETFNGILENTVFLKAFYAVDDNFSNLNNRYLALKSQIIRQLSSEGESAREDQKYIYIGMRGVGNFMETYLHLREELDKKEYQQLLSEMRISLEQANLSSK